MQAAGDLVGILVEFSAGVKLGHDHFGGGDAFRLVNVNGNAAAIVGDGDGTIGIEGDDNAIGMAGERFIDGVVHHLIDHVMEARTIVSIADIHARPLAHGVEALQHLD